VQQRVVSLVSEGEQSDDNSQTHHHRHHYYRTGDERQPLPSLPFTTTITVGGYGGDQGRGWGRRRDRSLDPGVGTGKGPLA
tara:strand:+ start:1568 stop:1810 length:243 start_codon:yes stop_codon:yes gene_type:complete